MNIGVIGSGGREHSLCFKFSQSKNVDKIYCIPGNAGTENYSENIDVDISNFDLIYEVVKNKNIELIFVGPEEPLVNGIVDFFQKKNIKIFGPSRKASQLEGSKIFMKNICKNFNIPSGKFAEVNKLDQAEEFLNNIGFPVVIKSDGLAAGKGVTICQNKKKALDDINDILQGKFETSKKAIIEEFLEGEELSYFVITDGTNLKPIGNAQDHKKIWEGDTGLNTGGMGAYSPSILISRELEEKIIKKIIEPTLYAMKKIGCEYKGILYAGLMVKNNEPKLIEYNIRFGDPECQVLMMRLNNDLLDLILSTFNNTLSLQKILWKDENAITTVAVNHGYPEAYQKGNVIKNIDLINQNNNQQLFHAGTKKNSEGEIIAVGGRVLNSTVTSKNLIQARDKSLEILDKLDWENKFYRRDIAFKAIKNK